MFTYECKQTHYKPSNLANMPPKGTKGAKGKAVAKPSGIPKSKKDDPKGVGDITNLTKKPPTRSASRNASELSGVQTCSKSRTASTTSTMEVRQLTANMGARTTRKSDIAPPEPAGRAEQPERGAQARRADSGEDLSLSSLPIPGIFEKEERPLPRSQSVDSFDGMYTNPEELGPQDLASNAPEAEPAGATKSTRRGVTVETIPEEQASFYQTAYLRN